ncbi:MAG: TIGR04211 family SH3 domain-containing protein [Desulfobacteraceae bacterium]|nr:TIGR04211 family SH3 domain-containing protein [Desulfobacteraceae bacterium]
MVRFRSGFVCAAFLALLCCADSASATQAYTTDTQEIPLQATPGSAGKTFLMLPPASTVELVNPNGWIHVRYTKPDGKVRDGWVQTKFVGARPPDSAVAKVLGSENDVLKEQVAAAESEKATLLQKEKELTDKLTKLNAAYEDLKNSSTNYIKLKGEYDSAKTSLASAQENIQTLVQENESLKFSRQMQFFLAGAGILVVGWFLGWATGRSRKKKKGSYYY